MWKSRKNVKSKTGKNHENSYKFTYEYLIKKKNVSLAQKYSISSDGEKIIANNSTDK